MNFAWRYEQLVSLLKPFAPCWTQSVLHYWPACRDALPDDWWQPLLDWPLDAMHQLDDVLAGAMEIPEGLDMPPGLRRFWEAVRPLVQFPRSPSAIPLSETQTLRMTAKKQHEIAAILPFLVERNEALGVKRAVDLGGGVGHLARTLATELRLPLVSIDRNADLQNMGRALLQKLRMTDVPLEFVNGEMQSARQDALDPYFEGDCLSVGLHTCGPLAWAHLKKSQRSRAVLNFGCCYDRMDVTRDCQQSAWARQHPLPWTSFALFLATRGRRRSLEELAMQERVNTWRLALHLFLQEEGLAAGFLAVGDAPRAIYAQSFADYAADRFRFLQLDFAARAGKADGYIMRSDVARSMREFFVINVVRNVFARPLEVLLLLDRALWMEEQGHRVELRQFFDHSVSPRNLGLFATFKNA
ncbi:methyltransferase [Oligoflexus tunisiensis]|uniref:methyltransferase n=1 Tax=Oligoflexus tunisiensis TaxID=708132 RepID=UPI001C408C19|nr:methyltransferase [Oligoflexus tunisiensis]